MRHARRFVFQLAKVIVTRNMFGEMLEWIGRLRLASDSRRRLNKWLISLPYSTVQRLEKPRYFVDIQVETKPEDCEKVVRLPSQSHP